MEKKEAEAILETRLLSWNMTFRAPRPEVSTQLLLNEIKAVEAYSIAFLQELPEELKSRIPKGWTLFSNVKKVGILVQDKLDSARIEASELKLKLQTFLREQGPFIKYLAAEQVKLNERDIPAKEIKKTDTLTLILEHILDLRVICLISKIKEDDQKNVLLVSYHGYNNGIIEDQKYLLNLLLLRYWKYFAVDLGCALIIGGDFNVPLQQNCSSLNFETLLIDDDFFRNENLNLYHESRFLKTRVVDYFLTYGSKVRLSEITTPCNQCSKDNSKTFYSILPKDHSLLSAGLLVPKLSLKTDADDDDEVTALLRDFKKKMFVKK